MGWQGGLSAVYRRAARRWESISILAPLLVAVSIDIALTLPSDATIYHHYANQALASPLFRKLPKEYPASALLLFLVPVLLHVPYKAGFAVLAALATLAFLVGSDGIAAFPGWSRRATIYLLVGAAALLFSRYDIFPAMATFLAVESSAPRQMGKSLGMGRRGESSETFSVGACSRLCVSRARRTGRWPVRRAVASCVPFAVVTGVQSAFSPGSALSPLLYEARRGFETESVAGNLTLLTDPLHVKWLFNFGSWEIVGGYRTGNFARGDSCNARRPDPGVAFNGEGSGFGRSMQFGGAIDIHPRRQGLLAPILNLACPLVGILATATGVGGGGRTDHTGLAVLVHRIGHRRSRVLYSCGGISHS